MELTKTFDWDMEKDYPVLETITPLEFFDKYPDIIGIVQHREKRYYETGDPNLDVVAFITLGDYYKNTPPEKFWIKFRLLCGRGIPALLPLQIYGHTTYDHRMGFYFVPTIIEVNGMKSISERQLLDTGASYCHMTFSMWLEMELEKKFLQENKELCELCKI